MTALVSRRQWLKFAAATTAGLVSQLPAPRNAHAARNPRWEEAIEKGLDWLRRNQSSRGHWNTQVYPTAMAALAGTALIGSGSTTSQGPFAKQVARASDFVISKSRENGLIGDPQSDARYTYGHGFSMLFCWISFVFFLITGIVVNCTGAIEFGYHGIGIVGAVSQRD